MSVLEPGEAGHTAVRNTAIIFGCPDDVAEQLTLLLELLQWTSRLATAVEEIIQSSPALIFVGAEVANRVDSELSNTLQQDMLRVVVVGQLANPAPQDVGRYAKFHRLDLPVDLDLAQRLIEGT